jgi:hypothetical protein
MHLDVKTETAISRGGLFGIHHAVVDNEKLVSCLTVWTGLLQRWSEGEFSM